jgi:ribosomal protein S18 acetylase RimI-like enzyme
MPDEGAIDIRIASADEIGPVQMLWHEYWAALKLPAGFQGFVEEAASLPGVYAQPRGRLLLASIQGEPAGTAALRPVSAGSCEAKRLYVRPEYRGKGIGQALLDRLVEEARAAGYQTIYCDTLKSMSAAQRMYRQNGFCEVAAYSSDPTPDAIYFALLL